MAQLTNNDRVTLETALNNLAETHHWRIINELVLSLASGDPNQRASIVLEYLRDRLHSVEQSPKYTGQLHLRS